MLLSAFLVSPSCWALSNDAKVPVLLYHSWQSAPPCDYAGNASVAFARDLEVIYQAGYTVVPARWVAEWAQGFRDGNMLPDKVVAITLDDGPNVDWVDETPATSNRVCGPITSIKSRMLHFKSTHPELPWYSPHASFFVIGSPLARMIIRGTGPSDEWWFEANSSGIAEVFNHSTDHDHDAIRTQYWDENLQTMIPIAGYGDGVWVGQGNFARINDPETATREVVNSAKYITSKTGVWPEMFAYPYGLASDYMRKVFFAQNVSNNHTFAAFCVTPTYVTRKSDPYCLGRFVFSNAWRSPAELQIILNRAQHE